MKWYRRRKDPRTVEVVHHRNGDRGDNHPDNLEVLPDQRAHMILHHYERREAAGVQPSVSG